MTIPPTDEGNESPLIVPRCDPDVVDFVREALDRTQHSDTEPFLVLTDEEVLALDPRLDDSHSVLPWLRAQHRELDLAREAGQRSLLARRLTTIDNDHQLTASRALELVAAARVAGAAMLHWTSNVSDEPLSTVTAIITIQPHGAMRELIPADGLHRFSVLSHAHLITWLTNASAPNHVAARGSETIPTTRWADWIAQELGGQPTHSEFRWYGPTHDNPAPTVRSWAVDATDDLAVLTEPAPDHMLRVSATDAGRLARHLGDLIEAALDPHRP